MGHISQEDLELTTHMELEQRWSKHLSSYLWAQAHLENMGSKPIEPRRSEFPLTAGEYLEWCRNHYAWEEQRNRYNELSEQLETQVYEALKALHENIPDGFWILIPAFDEYYQVWISTVYGPSFNAKIEILTPDE